METSGSTTCWVCVCRSLRVGAILYFIYAESDRFQYHKTQWQVQDGVQMLTAIGSQMFSWCFWFTLLFPTCCHCQDTALQTPEVLHCWFFRIIWFQYCNWFSLMQCELSHQLWNSRNTFMIIHGSAMPMASAFVEVPSSCCCMGPPAAGPPRFGRTWRCLHGTPEELGARSIELAASQRSAAADVGHGAGAECCAGPGATPEFLVLALEGRQIPKLSWNFLALLFALLVLMIGRWSQKCISTGFGTYQVVQDVYPCPKELPPWFLERQNISRRHPGHGLSWKLRYSMFGFKVLAFESTNNIFYTMINLWMLRYCNFRFLVWLSPSMCGYTVLSLMFEAWKALTCWAWMAAWQCAAATPPCRTKKWNASFAWHVGFTRPPTSIA